MARTPESEDGTKRSKKISVYVTDEEYAEIEKRFRRKKLSEVGREFFLGKMSVEHLGVNVIERAPFSLAVMDAGMRGDELQEMRMLAPRFMLSRDLLEYFDVSSNDFMFQVTDDVMAGQGMPSGSLVVVRPIVRLRLPRDGEPILWQVQREQEPGYRSAYPILRTFYAGEYENRPDDIRSVEIDEYTKVQHIAAVKAVFFARD